MNTLRLNKEMDCKREIEEKYQRIYIYFSKIIKSKYCAYRVGSFSNFLNLLLRIRRFIIIIQLYDVTNWRRRR